jgi:hypothetical protein
MASGYETKKDNRNHADTVHGKTFSVILLLTDKTKVNHASILEHTKHRKTQSVSLKSGQGFESFHLKRVYLPIEVLPRPSHVTKYIHSIHIYIQTSSTCLTGNRRSCIVVAADVYMQYAVTLVYKM